MLRRIALLIFSGILTLNLCGCFALVAGVAGGAGTAVWLSGKLTQEFHASYHETRDAARSAMHSLNLPITQEMLGENLTQIKGTYNDGREVQIDIHRVTDTSSKVEVRVGVGDKDAASILLRKIGDYL